MIFQGTLFLFSAAAVAFVAPAARGSGTQMVVERWQVSGNVDNQQYSSPLALINDRTVGELGIARYSDIRSQDGLVGKPLVADGVVYRSGALSRVNANDVPTGKPLWRFDPQVDLKDASLAAFWRTRYNRVVALWKN